MGNQEPMKEVEKMNQLVINALRKSPKTIVVGEVRDGEAMALIQGLSTGDCGYFTYHANTAVDMIDYLRNAMSHSRAQVHF